MSIPSEEQIWEHLQKIPVKYPVAIEFSSGITRWLCPPGNAAACDYTTRGHGFGYEVTVWPKWHSWTLYEGIGTPRFDLIRTRNGTQLWAQEIMIYRMQMRSQLLQAMEKMDELFPFLRAKGHSLNDNEPIFPEDFGLEITARNVMIEAIERWIDGLPGYSGDSQPKRKREDPSMVRTIEEAWE